MFFRIQRILVSNYRKTRQSEKSETEWIYRVYFLRSSINLSYFSRIIIKCLRACSFSINENCFAESTSVSCVTHRKVIESFYEERRKKLFFEIFVNFPLVVCHVCKCISSFLRRSRSLDFFPHTWVGPFVRKTLPSGGLSVSTSWCCILDAIKSIGWKISRHKFAGVGEGCPSDHRSRSTWCKFEALRWHRLSARLSAILSPGRGTSRRGLSPIEETESCFPFCLLFRVPRDETSRHLSRVIRKDTCQRARKRSSTKFDLSGLYVWFELFVVFKNGRKCLQLLREIFGW